MGRKALFTRVFLPYCAVLCALLFLRSSDGLGIGISPAAERMRTEANLIPFETVKRYHRAYTAGAIGFPLYFLNIYGNALLFLPMGILLPRIFGKGRFYLITVLLLILSAELIQLFVGVGRFDVDDIILNLSGAVLPLIFTKKLR